MNSKGYTYLLEQRIKEAPRGEIFVTSDFSDIADDHTIRRLLKRMADNGDIERVASGIYYAPKMSSILGEPVPPSPERVAYALARAHNWTIAPSEGTALNRLGLSTQVPTVWTYISDGPYRSRIVDGARIDFKHVTNKNVTGMSPATLLVIQALRALGEDRIDEAAIRKIRQRLSGEELGRLVAETERSTAWIRKAIRRIADQGEGK
jgi:predicted transcriptional regulator of viral defense system